MEFHLFPVVTFLMLALVAANAALPPQLYWKSVLPNTPMPKAIANLLHPDWRDEKFTSVGVGYGGVNVGAAKGYQGSGANVNVGVGQSPFNYLYAATETQLHDDPKATMFFTQRNLHRGAKMDLHFTQSSNSARFLPRQVVDSIPFSSNKVEDILNKFSVKAGSNMAESMKNTINECEENGIKGEEKQCVTSLESMVDFSTSKLETKNVEAVSTETKNETKLQKYTMIRGVKTLSENKVVVCHKLFYPYAVFYCHKTKIIKAYFVPLEGADGSRVKAVAVCHKDTTEWNPKHLAFKVLKVKPGTVPVCHFLPEDHVVWVPK